MTMKNVKRAIELASEMAPMLEELNNLILELDRSNLDGVTTGNLECIYRELNDAELLYDLKEVLEQAEEIDPEEEFELIHDPNDWDEEEGE